MTKFGKVDDETLRMLAFPRESDNGSISPTAPVSDISTIAGPSSVSPWSVMALPSKAQDLNGDIPDKRQSQPLRGLLYRVFLIYRLLFSFVGVVNVGVLIVILTTKSSMQWLATAAAANLVMAILIRQDVVINVLYAVFCSAPKSMPLWIRSRCARIYHLGGVHSGAGVCGTAWIIGLTVQASVSRVNEIEQTQSLATLVLSWLLCSLCCAMICSAWPAFRKKYHNAFEQTHRFVGWTILILFWARTISFVRDLTPVGKNLGLAMTENPSFWLLVLATCSIASSWLLLREVSVKSEPLSEHAVQLSFDYTVPMNGTFTRLSRRPLFEWHSFATIPVTKPSSPFEKPGFYLVISNAGDWTKSFICTPPKTLWVRGIPTCGVMRIATLFRRLVIIATGSGIGPLLGHISNPSCPTQLIWSASQPERTFGKDIMNTVRRNIPHAIVHDTKALGRPDLVQMGFNLAKDFHAEAVIIIANEKITKKIVYGLETRGIPAYGAIWDS